MGIKNLLQILSPTITSTTFSPTHLKLKNNRIAIDMPCLMHQGLTAQRNLSQSNGDLKRLLHGMNQYVLRTLCQLITQFSSDITTSLEHTYTSNKHDGKDDHHHHHHPSHHHHAHKKQKGQEQTLPLVIVCVFDGLDLPAKAIENGKRDASRQRYSNVVSSAIDHNRSIDQKTPITTNHQTNVSFHNTITTSTTNTTTTAMDGINSNDVSSLHSLNPFTTATMSSIETSLNTSYPSQSKQQQQQQQQKQQPIISQHQFSRSLAFSHDITLDDVIVLIQLLEAHPLLTNHIETIIAPYQADSQLAFLSQIDYVDAVYSEDSDLVVYGSKNTLFKLNRTIIQNTNNANNKSTTTNKFTFDQLLIGDINNCPLVTTISQSDQLVMAYFGPHIHTIKQSRPYLQQQHHSQIIRIFLASLHPTITLPDSTIHHLVMRSWNRYDIALFSILLGCDFLPNLPLIGVKTLSNLIISTHLYQIQQYLIIDNNTSLTNTNQQSISTSLPSQRELGPFDWSTMIRTTVEKAYEKNQKQPTQQPTQSDFRSKSQGSKISNLTNQRQSLDSMLKMVSSSVKTSTSDQVSSSVLQPSSQLTTLDTYLYKYSRFYRIPLDGIVSDRDTSRLADGIEQHLTLNQSLEIFEIILYRVLLIFCYETVWNPQTNQLTSCSRIDNPEYIEYLLGMARFDLFDQTKQLANPNTTNNSIKVDQESVIGQYPQLSWLLGSVDIPSYSPGTQWLIEQSDANHSSKLIPESNIGNIETTQLTIETTQLTIKAEPNPTTASIPDPLPQSISSLVIPPLITTNYGYFDDELERLPCLEPQPQDLYQSIKASKSLNQPIITSVTLPQVERDRYLLASPHSKQSLQFHADAIDNQSLRINLDPQPHSHNNPKFKPDPERTRLYQEYLTRQYMSTKDDVILIDNNIEKTKDTKLILDPILQHQKVQREKITSFLSKQPIISTSTIFDEVDEGEMNNETPTNSFKLQSYPKTKGKNSCHHNHFDNFDLSNPLSDNEIGSHSRKQSKNENIQHSSSFKSKSAFHQVNNTNHHSSTSQSSKHPQDESRQDYNKKPNASTTMTIKKNHKQINHFHAIQQQQQPVELLAPSKPQSNQQSRHNINITPQPLDPMKFVSPQSVLKSVNSNEARRNSFNQQQAIKLTGIIGHKTIPSKSHLSSNNYRHSPTRSHNERSEKEKMSVRNHLNGFDHHPHSRQTSRSSSATTKSREHSSSTQQRHHPKYNLQRNIVISSSSPISIDGTPHHPCPQTQLQNDARFRSNSPSRAPIKRSHHNIQLSNACEDVDIQTSFHKSNNQRSNNYIASPATVYPRVITASPVTVYPRVITASPVTVYPRVIDSQLITHQSSYTINSDNPNISSRSKFYTHRSNVFSPLTCDNDNNSLDAEWNFARDKRNDQIEFFSHKDQVPLTSPPLNQESSTSRFIDESLAPSVWDQYDHLR